MYYPQNQRNKRDELDSVPVKQALPQHTHLPDIQAIGQTKRLVVRPYISYENDPDVEREYKRPFSFDNLPVVTKYSPICPTTPL